MTDENDFIKKTYVGKDKTRIQKWYMHYCNTCGIKRSYLPRNKSNVCLSCAGVGKIISNRQRLNISKALKGNRNASNITELNKLKRTAKILGLSLEYYIQNAPAAHTVSRIKKNMLDRLSRFIKGNRKTFRYVEYNSIQLREHLESKFQFGMTWNNYGRKSNIRCWEIDHIIPLKYKQGGKYFWNQDELADPRSKTFIKAWSLDNLQPMWADENLRKHSKFRG